MRADEDVRLALREALDRGALVGRGAEARDVLDRERVVAQALGEGAEVLLGEDRRRHEHQHLLAGVGGLEGGAQRDLGLAVADVAADQPVHRALGLHVPLDLLDRLALVARLRVGEGGLEVAQPVRVGREREAAPVAALGVEVEQLAGELLGGAAGARLHRVPARPAELGERRVLAAGADVARDLRELVDRHEDAVRALELEVEVVARDAGDALRVEAGEAREPVVLVDDDVAGAQVGERAQQPAAAPRRPLGAPAAVDQPVLGDRGELQRRADEAVAEVGLREHEPAVLRLPARPQPLQVVGGALALAALRPRDERRVARARELLELRLGLVERAGGELGRLRAELERLRARDRGQPQRLAGLERRPRSRAARRRGGARRCRGRRRSRPPSGRAATARRPRRRRSRRRCGRGRGRAARGSGRPAAARRRRGGCRRPRARRSRPARGARRRARRRGRSRPAAPRPASAG